MAGKNETILKAFRFRYACKAFDPNKKVSEEDFATILEAARLSPSSFGFEPWQLIVLRDERIKAKLNPVAWGARNSLRGASHFVILLARKPVDTLYNAEYLAHVMRDVQRLPDHVLADRREAFKSFEESDFRLLESDRAQFDWACKQTYIVLGNMLTVAAYLGIDSCPIEGFDRQAVDRLLVEEGAFDATHFGVSVMAGFGYRGEQPHRAKTRRPLGEIVKYL
ncbi:MAG: NAD(P)H-dependent oxidoreductase [Sporolactobacillus sp.]